MLSGLPGLVSPLAAESLPMLLRLMVRSFTVAPIVVGGALLLLRLVLVPLGPLGLLLLLIVLLLLLLLMLLLLLLLMLLLVVVVLVVFSVLVSAVVVVLPWPGSTSAIEGGGDDSEATEDDLRRRPQLKDDRSEGGVEGRADDMVERIDEAEAASEDGTPEVVVLAAAGAADRNGRYSKDEAKAVQALCRRAK